MWRIPASFLLIYQKKFHPIHEVNTMLYLFFLSQILLISVVCSQMKRKGPVSDTVYTLHMQQAHTCTATSVLWGQSSQSSILDQTSVANWFIYAPFMSQSPLCPYLYENKSYVFKQRTVKRDYIVVSQLEITPPFRSELWNCIRNDAVYHLRHLGFWLVKLPSPHCLPLHLQQKRSVTIAA